MPNENSGDNPTANSQGQPLPQSPVAPMAPHKNEVREHPGGPSDDEETKTVKLEKDLFVAESDGSLALTLSLSF